MNALNPKKVGPHRRQFWSAAAMTIAAAQLSSFSSAKGQSAMANVAPMNAIKAGTNTPFAIKQINAGLLNVVLNNCQGEVAKSKQPGGLNANCIH